MTVHELFATCARGLEPALRAELEALGVDTSSGGSGGVAFAGDLEAAYRVALWSRVASRLLLVLSRFPGGGDGDDIYARALELNWQELLPRGETLAVDCVGKTEALSHTRYAAQRVKDAVVDQLRARRGTRPDVDPRAPGLQLHLHLASERSTLSLDLGGGGLHRRGYRDRDARAPLRETLAAGLLGLAEWPSRADGAFCDPLCGTGTLLLEAALIAADCAPGLLRGGDLGSPAWPGHDRAIWREVTQEARERDRRRSAPVAGPKIVGSDIDAAAIAAGRRALKSADLGGWVTLECCDVADRAAPADAGLLVTNPPYGERLGERVALERLYLWLGNTLKQRFGGWEAWVLSGSAELTPALGLRATRRYAVFNGPIECRLLRYPITASRGPKSRPGGQSSTTGDGDRLAGLRRLLREPAGSQMLANRLRKNLKKRRPWAKRENIDCYRIYDADIPEYASAIDVYGAALLVQEYAAPHSVDPARAEARLHDTLLIAAEVAGVEPQRVYLKVRERQRGAAQYERLEGSAEVFTVREGPCRFRVNLRDYLDTGIFLDHRPTRRLLGEKAAGRRFLNLFCYTGTATVYAALGGAISSTSVDLSATYLDWARDNLRQNGIRSGGQHELVQSDVLRWVEDAARKARGPRGRRFGLIFCDPPTFSNSKRMRGTFDVQRDHRALLRDVARLLEDGGELYFSCNKRGFVIDAEALPELAIEDISTRSIPVDFARSPKIHRCFRITRR